MTSADIINNYQQAIWADKNIHAIDEYFANNAIIHSPVKTTHGTDNMKAVIQQWYNAFPNLTVYWDELICDGNKIVSRWHAEGQHQGEFQGKAATNKTINYSGVTIYHLADQKIVEYWAYLDMQSIMSQLD